MTATVRSAAVRWISLSVLLLLLLALLAWMGTAPAIAYLVERELRSAGWIEPSVEGVSLISRGVRIDRVRLAADDTIVLEDVRARVGRRGIESVTIARLSAEAEVDDGRVILPGLESSEGADWPLALVPPQGIGVAHADISLLTAAGEASMSLSNVLVQQTPDAVVLSAATVVDHAAGRLEGPVELEIEPSGAVSVRLQIVAGHLQAGGVRVTGLSGEAAGAFSASTSTFAAGIGAGATELADVAMGALALQADWQDGVGQFALTSPDPRAADVAVEGTVDLRAATPAMSLSGRVSLLDVSEASGELELDAHVTGSADGRSQVSGFVQLAARNLVVPGMLGETAFEIAADIEGDPLRRLRFTSADGWEARITPAGERLPAAMQPFAGEAVALAIAPRADEPLAMIEVAWGEKSVRFEGILEASAGESSLSGAGRLAARWAGGVEAGAETSGLSAQGLPWESMIVDIEGFVGTARYAGGAWRVDGAGAIHATGSMAATSFAGFTARWSGAVTGTPESIALVPGDCIQWSVAALEVNGTRLANLEPPCLRPSDGSALLTYHLAQGAAVFAASMAQQPFEVEVATAGRETVVNGTWPTLEVAGVSRDNVLDAMTVRASGGAATLPGAGLAIEGLGGSAEISDGAIVSSTLQASTIEHLGAPALWAPLGAEVSVTGEESGVSFEVLLSDDLGVWVFEARGSYAQGEGRSEMTLYPVQFISGATEIRDLSPHLAQYVQDAAGAIGFEGEIEWGPDTMGSAGNLSVQNFGATVFGVAVAGVDATVVFESLLPPLTLPDQMMEIDRISLGVPLEHGVAVYALEEGGRIAVQRLEFDFAGGRLYAEPFTFDSADMRDIGFVLRAEDVQLSQMLALSQIDGLQGTGVLSGRVPARISDSGLEFDAGTLAAEADGVLRYAPEDLPEFLRGDDMRASMLREVLTNFHYEELSVTFAGESDGAQTLRLTARGANPDFLDGHPIELAFNFEGPLLGAVRSAIDVSGAVEIEEMSDRQRGEDEETIQ